MITFLSVLVAIPKAILLGLAYLFRQKAFLFLIVIGIGAVFLFGYFNKSKPDQVELPSYQMVIPTTQQAPYVVQTSSRIYYVSTMEDNADMLVLTDYYIYDKNEWEHIQTALPLDKQVFGEIEIYNR